MRIRRAAIVGVVLTLLSAIPTADVGAQESTRQVSPSLVRWDSDADALVPDTNSSFVNSYDSRYGYTCHVDNTGSRSHLHQVLWSWHETPPGLYRVQVYIPPQEATAVVYYEIYSRSEVIDDRGSYGTSYHRAPVEINQFEHRGTWVTIAEPYHTGGSLWLALPRHSTRPSGTNDQCGGDGQHTIGFADARLVSLAGDEPPPPPAGSDAPGQAIAFSWLMELPTHMSHYYIRWLADAGSSPILRWEVKGTRTDFDPYEMRLEGFVRGRDVTVWENESLTMEVRACNEHGCGPWSRPTVFAGRTPPSSEESAAAQAEEPATAQDPSPDPADRQVTISLDRLDAECHYRRIGMEEVYGYGAGIQFYYQVCEASVEIAYEGFDAGPYALRCYHRIGDRDYEEFYSVRREHYQILQLAELRRCRYPALPLPAYLKVSVDGVESNTIQLEGSPSKPRILRPSRGAGDSTVIRWLPPAADGGSAITRYIYSICNLSLRGGCEEGTVGATERRLVITDPGLRQSYRIHLRAENRKEFIGDLTEYTYSTPCRASASGAKYERRRTWPSPTHVYALVDFRTNDGRLVSRGDKGGITSSNVNLVQDGCSWVALDARVVDQAQVRADALVKGTALVAGVARVYDSAVISGGVVRGDACVYGHARVSGGVVEGSARTCSARVYGNATVSGGVVRGSARIHGDATVSGGVVEGRAQVYGEARVSGGVVRGNVHVRGTAAIGEGMELDGSGVYDGKQEYARAAKQIYDELFTAIMSTLDDCNVTRSYSSDRKESLAKDVLAGVFRIDYGGCAWLAQMREFAIRITPNSVDLALQYAFPLLGSLHLDLYAKSLVTIASGVKDMRDIRNLGNNADALRKAMESTKEEFEKLRALEDLSR